MKVSELIEQLQQMNPDAEVHYAYNYGDYWKTTVAPQVTTVFEGTVRHSTYHNMDALVDEYEDRDEEELRQVVVIE